MPADGFEYVVGDDIDEQVFDGVPPIPDFQQPTGPSGNVTDKSPLVFSTLMVTDEMLDHIVEQTNIYAQQYLVTTPSLHTHEYTAGIRKSTTKLSSRSSWP